MKLYKLLYLSLLLPFMSSCSLDKEPYGLAGLWETEGNAQKGLDAAYQPLYEEEGYGEGHWWAGPLSDDMLMNQDESEIFRLSTFSTPTNTFWAMKDNWKIMYKIIRRASDVIKNVPKIDMPEAKKNEMLGEANFLCGYAYFFLAKRYGGLPFYDSKTPNDYNKPRETKEQTYRNIESYLKASIDCFSDVNGQELWIRSSNDWGRPNLGAAYGLLAKVYAHWGKMTEAKENAFKVIKSSRYELATNNNNGYDYLFSLDGEKSDEVLFNLTNQPVRHKGTVTSIITLSGSLSGNGWSMFAPTESLRKAYKPGDLRRKTVMVEPGDKVTLLGKEVTITKENISDMKTGFMSAKYLNAYKNASIYSWESGADVPLLRYSDVLLIYVEAAMAEKGLDSKNRETTTSDPEILKYFNEVHVRAFGNNPDAAVSEINFMDLVNERRCELAYEDERHYDLVRWGLAQEVYASPNDPYAVNGVGRTFDPKKDAHLPLPQTEIENSNGVLINNPAPGYSDFSSVK